MTGGSTQTDELQAKRIKIVNEKKVRINDSVPSTNLINQSSKTHYFFKPYGDQSNEHLHVLLKLHKKRQKAQLLQNNR